MIASDVITKARYTLSDLEATRWSDTRLLSLLTDALVDIATTSNLYRSNGWLKLQKNIAVYLLSDLTIHIERIEYLGVPLQMITFKEMDALVGHGWKTEAGDEIKYIVYDLKHGGQFRVYPIPLLGGNDLTVANTDYGIVTDIRYSDARFDLVTDFGDLAGPNMAEYLEVYYVKMPAAVTDLTTALDDVVTPPMLSMLAHYVAGQAMLDNMDTVSREIGATELMQYAASKDQLIARRTGNNVTRIRTTDYRGMI